MKKIANISFIFLTLRSFFIRSFYNYNDLFGMGICSSVCRIIRKNCGHELSKDELNELAEFVNMNEYLSGYAIGVYLKYELNSEKDKLKKIKPILSITLGAIGDNLIYKNLIPVIILIVLNKIMISGMITNSLLIILISVLIMIFFVFNFFIRYSGLKSGYKNGINSLKVFKSKPYLHIYKFILFVKKMLLVTLLFNIIIFSSVQVFSSKNLFVIALSIFILIVLKLLKNLHTDQAALFYFLIILTISCFF